ncbi:MAG: hypothetical protein AAF570_13940 [Bacteroidota bacterium]
MKSKVRHLRQALLDWTYRAVHKTVGPRYYKLFIILILLKSS